MIESINLENYYVYYQDFSSERNRGVFDDGEGWYLNASAKTKYGQVMASYWHGNEFISIKAGQLYPSISSTFKTPDHVEKFRELLFLRLMYEGEITTGLKLAGRIEPYYDLRNKLGEFSAGIYITYQTDFLSLNSGKIDDKENFVGLPCCRFDFLRMELQIPYLWSGSSQRPT